MEQRIAFMSYPRLTNLVKKVLPDNILNKILIFEGSFKETLEKARELKEKDKVDVFVSGGSNARILSEHFKDIPIVTINIAGFDFMKVLAKAKRISNKVLVVTYKEKIRELDRFKELLNIELHQRIFTNKKELNQIIKTCTEEGFKVIIGSSLVCDCAEKYGLNPVFIYSDSSILNAFNQAISLAKTIRSEKRKSNLLKTIIDFSYSGIIAIDEKGIVQVYNPIAESIFGIPRKEVLNRKVEEIIPNTRLNKVLETGIRETNQIQKVNSNKMILTNRIPIIVNNAIMGVVATFQDTTYIQKAEQKIRRKLYEKGLYAKYTFNDILGNSKAIKNAKEIAKTYSKNDSTVLIFGETGTGKELFAHSIHNFSYRKDKPFVAVNCAALPEDLLESELFGYEEGAFTGARKGGKQGLFELAHNGTIFLDEISEMPIKLQARLLRVLQEKEIMRIGGDKIIPVDVRIIAATNKRLNEEVEKGRFREDLYYRLNVLNFTVPPLRERKEDIPILVREIIRKNYPELLEKNELLDEINGRFQNYSWPGNIRQLENVTKRLCALLKNYKFKKDSYHELFQRVFDGNYTCSKLFVPDEKQTIINILNKVKWNRSKAADLLGISRTTLWRKMKELNIKP